MAVGAQYDLGAPNFCTKNDLMHWVLHEKSIGFSVQIRRCSPKKKVFTEIETVFRHWCAYIKQLFARIFDVLNQMGERPPPQPPPASYGYVWDCCLCWNGLKSDLKHLLKHIFRGANLSKIKVTYQSKLRKMPKNKHWNLIANVKMPNISFINKCIISSKIRGKGGAIQY